MKEFFGKLEIRARPRVLALTTNFIKQEPMNSRADVDEALEQLEAIYHSKIVLARESFDFF